MEVDNVEITPPLPGQKLRNFANEEISISHLALIGLSAGAIFTLMQARYRSGIISGLEQSEDVILEQMNNLPVLTQDPELLKQSIDARTTLLDTLRNNHDLSDMARFEKMKVNALLISIFIAQGVLAVRENLSDKGKKIKVSTHILPFIANRLDSRSNNSKKS